MCADLDTDFRRYLGGGNPGLKSIVYACLEQGVWALTVYRFGRWVRTWYVPVVSEVLRIAAFILFKFIEIITGISLPASARIGKGFYIGHFGGIIVHSDAEIGENCSIGTGVIIGTRGVGNVGVPTIGNNVYIGTGAKILGKIRIGDNVKIGANAVVVTDIPDNATAVGVPARILSEEPAP